VQLAATQGPAAHRSMIRIPGGTFRMGSDKHYPEEAPVHRVAVDGFWIDRTPVTNRQFKDFAKATGHVTFAEIPPDPKDYPGALPHMLHAGSLVFEPPARVADLRDWSQWWTFLKGADWRHPYGPRSNINGLDNHPVVHVTLSDALAYATWAGKDLPTEAEWEFAACGGLHGAEFVWGDEFTPGGKLMANTWQGEFPWQNLKTDGFEGTAPVGSFSPNGYGLYDMAGNVWEWSTDWYQEHSEIPHSCCASFNPKGGEREQSYDPCVPEIKIPRKVMKGGSFLCAPNYCRRYRPAARMAQPLDTSTCHLGFRGLVRVKREDRERNDSGAQWRRRRNEITKVEASPFCNRCVIEGSLRTARWWNRPGPPHCQTLYGQSEPKSER
jgi:formylglycine-generating enzyme